MEPERWRRVSTRPVYANQWMSLREDIVEMPDGNQTLYGVVTTGHGVGVLPFVDADTVLLVRQFRYVADRVTWEMPTGGVDDGESLAEAAQRELIEESGHRAGRLVPVSTFHSSKSIVDETVHVYFGFDLAPVEAPHVDRTEFLEVRPHAFDDVLEMVLSDEIVDAMTVVAVLRAARLRDQGTLLEG